MPSIRELQIKRCMKDAWTNNYRPRKRRVSPKDAVYYNIDARIINFTETVLRQYGTAVTPSEGVVYWAGRQSGDRYFITAAVAPATVTSRYGFSTSHTANARYVEFICDNDLVHIAQVHSHPGSWVDHSPVDDGQTAFRSAGLVSIVVPNFSAEGMLPVKLWGVHRYEGGKFNRLSDKYAKERFIITAGELNQIITKDFRYE